MAGIVLDGQWWTKLPANCTLNHNHDRLSCYTNACVRCKSLFDPSTKLDGARYLLNGRWLCPECNQLEFFT